MTAIQKIHSFERFGSILGLERMTVLMKFLGNPEKDMKYIHVAGTNGKGSVCKYIYEALRENGYKTGIYLSPFIEVFNERIEIDGTPISDQDLETCTDEVLMRVNEMTCAGYDSPTEFEIITAVAFLYFRKMDADFVVLEVGLGGTGDSTNVIESPVISVITSISFDHMDRLGDTLTQIAGEKAGIIKEGVPVVSNVPESEAAKVIARTAYEKNCILYDVSKIKHRITGMSLKGSIFDTVLCGTDYSGVEISMIGEHQIQNAVTALAAIEVLRKNGTIRIERSKLYQGLKNAKQIGRFEVLRDKPYVVIDGAHNEKGAEALKKTVFEHFDGAKILMVVGILADKDSDRILREFCEITDDFIATETGNPRGLPAEELRIKFEANGKNCIGIKDPEEALHEALERGKEADLILFAGSLYLIGKIRGVLQK